MIDVSVICDHAGCGARFSGGDQSRTAALRAAHRAGWSVSRHPGCCTTAMCPDHIYQQGPDRVRQGEIVEMRAKGATLRAIGIRYGIDASRVCRILARARRDP
jgi:DNA invertase Pin-like site-specific DNA recombinase